MAKHIFAVILITYLVFGHNSIMIFVNSEIHSYQQHHIRHQHQHNHHQRHHHNHNQNHKLTPNLWTILDKGGKQHKTNGLHSDKSSDVVFSRLKEAIYSNNQVDKTSGNVNSDTIQIVQESSVSTSNGNSNNNGGIKCPKCSGSTNVRVSEEELYELRIEFVKNQILQKLRLKERPQVSASNLPKPIYEGATLHNDEKSMSKDLDDYYARTSQKFIFLEREDKECYRFNQTPSICFSFKIDGDVDGIDVNTAELWVYKKQSERDIMKQTLVVSEVERGKNSKYLPKSKPIAIQSTGVEEGWIKFDIAWSIRRWFGNHNLDHLIHISCQSCEMEITEGLISTDKDYRPFIVIDTQNSRKRRRQKRSVNCTAGATECCREKLYISFAYIGWDDWIIQPPGYNAYFCRGSCSSAASITMSGSHHSSLVRKVIYQQESNGTKPLELIPCCTAKKYSSLQLIYRDSNSTATLKTLPNMVVEACGCM